MKHRIISALRWSERYTKTDMVYIARGGFWSTVGQGAVSISTLVLAVVVSMYLSKETYGAYKYILSIVALLSVFSLNGLTGAVFQSVAHGFEGALRHGFFKNVQWSIAVFLGALGIGVYYVYFGNYTLGLGILIGGCLSPFLVSANLASSFLGARRDFARQTLYFGLFGTLAPVVVLILTILLTQSPLVLASVYFVSNTLVALFLYYRVMRLYRPDSTKTDSGMMPYGKHLSAMGVFNVIAGNIDQVILFQFVGPVQVAIYAFAIAIPEQVKGPLKMLDSMIQAKFATRDDTAIRAGMRNKILLLFLFTLATVAAYIAAAPAIFALIFPNYMDAVIYSQIYALSLFGLVLTPASSYLQIKRRVREQYIFNIVTSLFQIAVMLIGVYWWGLLGLVVARVTARFFGGTVTLLLFQRAVRQAQ